MTKDPLAPDLKVILKWKDDESEKKESDSGKEKISGNGIDENNENNRNQENENLEEEKSSDSEKKKDDEAKVGVKQEEDVDEDGYKTKEYQLHAAVLAGYSAFVKKALTMDMKEKQEMTIVFHDVNPQVYDSALKYVYDSSAAYCMSVADAVAVLPFYDKYEFSTGLKLCDFVMDLYIREEMINMCCLSTTWGEGWTIPPSNLELLVTCLEMSSYGLKNTKAAAVKFLLKNLKAYDKPIVRREHSTPVTYGPTIFSTDHVQKLQALLIEDVFPLIRAEAGETNMKEILQLPNEVLSGNGFPFIFVSEMAGIYTKYLRPSDAITTKVFVGVGNEPDTTNEFTGMVYRLNLSVAAGTTDVVYHQGKPPRFTIKKEDNGDWVIEKQVENAENIVYWKCPYSRNLPYPPIALWERVHGNDAEGGRECLEIRYFRSP